MAYTLHCSGAVILEIDSGLLRLPNQLAPQLTLNWLHFSSAYTRQMWGATDTGIAPRSRNCTSISQSSKILWEEIKRIQWCGSEGWWSVEVGCVLLSSKCSHFSLSAPVLTSHGSAFSARGRGWGSGLLAEILQDLNAWTLSIPRNLLMRKPMCTKTFFRLFFFLSKETTGQL